MSATKRATIYLEAPLYRALRRKSVLSAASLSELVSNAVRRGLAEDAEDLAAFHNRAKDPRLSVASVVRHLRKRGKL